MFRTIIASAVLFTALALPLQAAGLDDRDFLYDEDGKIVATGIVYHETREGVEYKTSPAVPTMQSKRWSQVERVVYNGMGGNSYYAIGMSDMASGQYETAAQRFAALAAGEGKREWEQAYGWFYEGVAWERAGAHDKAAVAFGKLAENIPQHRLALNAFYRLGINQARTGDHEAAVATAEALDTIAEEERERAAESRAAAIRAAVAAVKGELDEARSLSRRVTFSQRDGATYLHWSQFWAGFLMDQERFADAAAVYGRLLENAGDYDPVETAALSLGYGVALAKDGNRDRALTALMRLDALPYGSPEQRLVARYWIGRLMWELAQERMDHERDRVADFAKASVDEARRILESVAASTLANPIKDEAAELLEELPGGEAEEGAEEAGEDAADPAAPAE